MSGRGTQPTGRRRWPRYAEIERGESEELATEIARIAREIRNNLDNKYVLPLMAADIEIYAERIRRLMVQAKQGVEEK